RAATWRRAGGGPSTSLGSALAPTEAGAALSILSRSIRASLSDWHRVTFDRPAADGAALPPLRPRIAGLDAQSGEAVRRSVLAALAGIRLGPARHDDESAWTLELVPAIESAPGSAATVSWSVLLRDAAGRQAMRAAYASPLDAERRAESLAASARA